jgi:regulator of replication initiation timing
MDMHHTNNFLARIHTKKSSVAELNPIAVIEAVHAATTTKNNLMKENAELLKENMELKDQLHKINEDYLKEFANNEIQKLKSHIKELELYIEGRKDIQSKAEDSRRLWRREFAIVNVIYSDATDKNLSDFIQTKVIIRIFIFN